MTPGMLALPALAFHFPAAFYTVGLAWFVQRVH
jgi:hypothetical protein